jgi:hypothetical protein
LVVVVDCVPKILLSAVLSTRSTGGHIEPAGEFEMSLCNLFVALLMISLCLFGCDKKTGDLEISIETSKEKVSRENGPDIKRVVAPFVDAQRAQTEMNHLPEIKSAAFVDPYIHSGVDIEVIPVADDSDLDDITLDYRWFLNGLELFKEKAAILPGDLFSKGDKVSLWITPSDQYGAGEIFYSSEMIIPNAPPEVSTQNDILMKENILSGVISASDPDNDKLVFVLQGAPEGMKINRDSGELYWSRKSDQRGPYRVNIIVKDEDGAQSILPFEIGAQVEN